MITRPQCKAATRILLSVPHMGGAEIRYVQESFATNWLSTVGPNLTALEKAFSDLVGLPSVALASGTAGLHLGLKLFGIKPGEEVISPTLTFAASCNPVLYEGAVPVFIDSDPVSWNLDPQLLADFLNKRARLNRLPKALVAVNLFGQCADMEAIRSLCQAHGLLVLEDAAESLGAFYKGRPAGSCGDVGVFSFNGNKIITSSGGGMLVSSRRDWVDKARHWSTQARDPDPLGINNYVHSDLGYNYRLSNVLAGMARGQLEVLETRVQQRRAIFETYRTAFAGVSGIQPHAEVFADAEGTTSLAAWNENHKLSRHTRWLSCFLILEEEFGMSAADLIRWLDWANVEARPVWKPMHTQPLYRRYEIMGGQVAEDLNQRGICLPSSSSLTEEQQQFVIDRIKEAHQAFAVKHSG